jgi:hypothetical protein
LTNLSRDASFSYFSVSENRVSACVDENELRKRAQEKQRSRGPYENKYPGLKKEGHYLLLFKIQAPWRRIFLYPI